jgi:hypothetical protein
VNSNHKKILFVGDFCLSGDAAAEVVNKKGLKPFQELKTLVAKDCIVIANIECPFTSQEDGKLYKWANLKANPEMASVLEGLSVGVIGNNHIGDYGHKGALDTINILQKKNINYAGYGGDISEALKPAIINMAGLKIEILSLCCITTNSECIATHDSPGVAPIGMEIVKKAVIEAKANCEIVILFLHWGIEWVHEPAPDQMRIARHAIDCGADAVIGCHSHTIQSYERYKGKWIFYSLGNFLFKAGYAEKHDKFGNIIKIPLIQKKENKQSMGVEFEVDHRSTHKSILLSNIYFFESCQNLSIKPIQKERLTFNLGESVKKLQDFSRMNNNYLESRSEIVYKTKLRNGIVAYWYMIESLNDFGNRTFFKKVFAYFINKVSRYRKNLSIKVVRLIHKLYIHFKWFKDESVLPLSKDHHNYYIIIHRYYWKKLGSYPNLIKCNAFNDKIQWLKLFDQDQEMIRCSDKLLVRDYIEERIGNKHLPRLYQAHDHFSEIDFSSLPKSFVIKTNHDSGTVILVKDKDRFDKQIAEKHIEEALSKTYGWLKGEWAYSYIKPKVFVEEYLNPESDINPPDYKFYCVEGKARFCHFIYDRNIEPKEQIIDLAGEDLKTLLYPSFKYGDAFVKPSNWTEMIRIAELLGRGFKFVRVDLYNVNNIIICGEMTFWPMAGCYKGEGQKKLGKYLDFDRKTSKPFLIPQLDREIGRQR